MYKLSVLDAWFERNCAFMHDGRCAAVLRVTRALLGSSKAYLTEIGRHVFNDGRHKSGIKCVDRLLRNKKLHAERVQVYAQVAKWLLSRTPRPFILVDWSEVCPGNRFVMLKATVPLKGRALTIYEEVYPLKQHNTPRAHRAFLQRLSSLVPPGCHPIVVTDAGFRGPWFRAVEALGWGWIGRVRNNVKCRLAGEKGWTLNTLLYRKATNTPTYVGAGHLSKQCPYACHLHLYQGFKRGPGRPRKPFRSTLTHKRARLAAREPWLLATSLPAQEWTAQRVVQAYKKRMQIEETFRDMKNPRWGYALEYARSRSAARLENLLLITTLAMLTTWLVGLAAKAKNLDRQMQANTERKRPVLSIHFIGRQIIEASAELLSPPSLRRALKDLVLLVQHGTNCDKIVGIS
ncbi:MAG: hypothetical protein AMXMBFR59_42870 [Rhodanobacteraceae bacterium]